MHPWTRHLVSIVAASLLCSSLAHAQSLDRIQMQYQDRLPQVLVGGISPYYWDNIESTVSVSDRSISIVLHTPDAGFSVMTAWSLVVPLPPLPVQGNYAISVALGSSNGTVSEPIGIMHPWIFDARGPDPIFRSSFE